MERAARRRRALRVASPAAEEGRAVVHVVCEPCINCKYTDCVTVCPVDCFYEGKNVLVIHPGECPPWQAFPTAT